MRRMKMVLAVTALSTVLSAGCGRQSDDSRTTASSEPASSVEQSEYLLAEEPQDAQEIAAARVEAADGQPVTVVGRIGGSSDPWIEGRAAFSLVDRSLQACSDRPGDDCPVPWDYCCETDKLPTSTALVKVVDEQGQLVKSDARSLLGVRELQTVVVQGEAERDEAGNLTVLARKIYVQDTP